MVARIAEVAVVRQVLGGTGAPRISIDSFAGEKSVLSSAIAAS